MRPIRQHHAAFGRRENSSERRAWYAWVEANIWGRIRPRRSARLGNRHAAGGCSSGTSAWPCVPCKHDGATSVDHVLARANGGGHEQANVVPACRSCNSSKRDREATREWVETRHVGSGCGREAVLHHWQRQAGRYARAQYRLALHEARRNEQMRQVQLALMRVQVRARLRELQAENCCRGPTGRKRGPERYVRSSRNRSGRRRSSGCAHTGRDGRKAGAKRAFAAPRLQNRTT